MKERIPVQANENYYNFKIQTCKNPDIFPYTSGKKYFSILKIE